MSRMNPPRRVNGFSLLEAMILLVLLGGMILLAFMANRIEARSAARGDGIQIQATEMSQITRAVIGRGIQLKEAGNAPAPGTRVEVDLNQLSTLEFLPARFAWRGGNNFPTAPTGQRYRAVQLWGPDGTSNVLVWSDGAMDPGLAERAGVLPTPSGPQEYGLAIVKQLLGVGPVKPGWADAGTKAFKASATGQTTDLSHMLASPFSAGSVALYHETTAGEVEVELPDPTPGAKNCSLVRNATSCPTGQQLAATFSACEGVTSTGDFTGKTIDTIGGTLTFQLQPSQMTPAASSCGGTCSGCSVPTSCQNWTSGTTVEEMPPGGSVVAPKNSIAGWMQWDRQVRTLLNGSPILSETCIRLRLSQSGFTPIKSTVTAGAQPAATHALCCS